MVALCQTTQRHNPANCSACRYSELKAHFFGNNNNFAQPICHIPLLQILKMFVCGELQWLRAQSEFQSINQTL